MKRIIAILLVVFCSHASVVAGDKAQSPGQDQVDGKRLRLLLPKIVKASATTMVHEALLIIRDDAIPNRIPSGGSLSEVVARLRRVLDTRKREEPCTRRLACEIFWRARWKKAAPVLLEALVDPYEETDFVSVGAGGPPDLDWYAVWKSAENAVRNLTGASPIDAPRQREPVSGQREKVRKAWLKWYRQNGEQCKSSVPGERRR